MTIETSVKCAFRSSIAIIVGLEAMIRDRPDRLSIYR
jgi:hypothetical protein